MTSKKNENNDVMSKEEDEYLANLDLLGMGNRNETIIALSKMSDEGFAQWRAGWDEKLKVLCDFHVRSIDEQMAIVNHPKEDNKKEIK